MRQAERAASQRRRHERWKPEGARRHQFADSMRSMTARPLAVMPIPLFVFDYSSCNVDPANLAIQKAQYCTDMEILCMNEIAINFSSPAWWFNMGFPLFFAWIVSRAFLFFKHKVKKAFRYNKLKLAKYIKTNRHNLAAVNYQMMMSLCCFITFFFTCALYLYLIITGPLIQVKEQSTAAFFICLIPLIIIELIYLNQRDRAMRLVSEYNKVRIKRTCAHVRSQC